jgi:hypothetical protein
MTARKKTGARRAKKTTSKGKTTRQRKAPAKHKVAAKKPAKLPVAHHFKNRIVGYEDVDPRTINRNPLNWRVHPELQRLAMNDALEQLGYVDTVIVNVNTRNLIDGEMRLDLAEANNEPSVPVLWVDLTKAEERLALATFNPMAELAATDPEQLGKLLSDLEREGGPLDELLGSLEQMAISAQVKPSKSSGRGTTATVGHTLRLVMSVPDVVMIERAVLMTGQHNRGEAFMAICKHYLESFDHGDEERQHDAGAQGKSEDQLAQALAGVDLGT